MGSKPNVPRGHYSTKPKPFPDLTINIVKKLKNKEELTKEEQQYAKKFSPSYWGYLACHSRN